MFADDAWNPSGSLRCQPEPQISGLSSSDVYSPVYFLFCHMKKKENVIPLVCETNSRCKRDMHCCCVMYRCIFLCIKGHDSRCISTLQMCVVLYCTAVMTGLLCCFPFFEGLGLQWFVTDVTVGCLTARFLIGSLFMTNTAFVSRFLPVSLTSYPPTHIISCMGGIVLLIGVCSNQSQMGEKNSILETKLKTFHDLTELIYWCYINRVLFCH